LAEAVEEIRRTGLTMPADTRANSTQGSNPPFFCIHPIGGGVYGLVDLGRSNASGPAILCIQAMGLAAITER